MEVTAVSVVNSISAAFEVVDIPCILWGHMMLGVHGVPTILGVSGLTTSTYVKADEIQSIDFVITEEDLNSARDALAPLSDISICADGSSCPRFPGNNSLRSPTLHMHIPALDITSNVYLQSSKLWFMPPLRQPTLSTLPPYLLLASDQNALPAYSVGRGRGVLPVSQHRVLVPQAHIILEAHIRMLALDFGTNNGPDTIATIAYVSMYIDNDDRLDLEELDEPLRRFYLQFRHERNMSLREKVMQLKNALGVTMVDPDEDW